MSSRAIPTSSQSDTTMPPRFTSIRSGIVAAILQSGAAIRSSWRKWVPCGPRKLLERERNDTVGTQERIHPSPGRISGRQSSRNEHSLADAATSGLGLGQSAWDDAAHGLP